MLRMTEVGKQGRGKLSHQVGHKVAVSGLRDGTNLDLTARPAPRHTPGSRLPTHADEREQEEMRSWRDGEMQSLAAWQRFSLGERFEASHDVAPRHAASPPARTSRTRRQKSPS